MKAKVISILALLLTVTQGAWAANPEGMADECTSHPDSLYVRGWVFDPDNKNTNIDVHVYIYSDAACTSVVKSFNLGETSVADAGLVSSNGLGSGVTPRFAKYIDVSNLTVGTTYYVKFFAINIGSSEGNPELAYSNTTTVTPQSLTVFKVTIQAPYNVTYNANSGSGAPSEQKKLYGINLTLSSTQPTRTGYTFNGWNTASNGSGTNYAAGATYSANAGATLYAKWTPVNYTITYDLDGGSVASENPTSYTVESAAITLNNPTKEGYTFAGWTGTGLGSASTSVTIASGSTGDRSYTATYNAIPTHSATWDATDTEAGNWTVSPATPYEGQEVTATYSGSRHVKSVKYVGVPSLTAPTAKTGLVYTGAAQALVNAGSTTGGELQYKLGAEGEYSSDVPTATNAGTYTVYYKVDGSDGFKDIDEASVEVTIDKATPTITLSPTSLSFAASDYQNSTKTFTVNRTGTGTITVTSGTTSVVTVSGTSTVTVKRITGGAGSSTITVSVEATDNYAATSKTLTASTTAICVSSLSALKTAVNAANGDLTYLRNNYNGKYVTSSGAMQDNTSGAIGIITYISSTAVDTDFSDSRIFVLALTDASTSAYQYKTDTEELTYNNLTALNGYTATEHWHKWPDDFPASEAARNYSASRPSGASSWFLPSRGQWLLGGTGVVSDVMKQTLTAGQVYWTSTALSSSQATQNFGQVYDYKWGGIGQDGRTIERYVRSAFVY